MYLPTINQWFCVKYKHIFIIIFNSKTSEFSPYDYLMLIEFLRDNFLRYWFFLYFCCSN